MFSYVLLCFLLNKINTFTHRVWYWGSSPFQKVLVIVLHYLHNSTAFHHFYYFSHPVRIKITEQRRWAHFWCFCWYRVSGVFAGFLVFLLVFSGAFVLILESLFLTLNRKMWMLVENSYYASLSTSSMSSLYCHYCWLVLLNLLISCGSVFVADSEHEVLLSLIFYIFSFSD